MENRRYMCFAAVLIAVCLAVALVLGTGTTQARISSTVMWNVVYAADAAELESNYLEVGGQTVVTDDWSYGSAIVSRTESITLNYKSQAVSGTLSCSTESDLVAASLDKTLLTSDSGGASANLTLTLTQKALTLTENTKVTVRVTWTPSNSSATAAWADFIIRLCPAGAAEALPDDESVGLSSNYLVSGGKTLELSDWAVTANSTYRTKDIELVTYAGEISGKLQCRSYSDYVTATLDDSTEAVPVTVGDSNKYISILKLTPSEAAMDLEEQTTATVRVSWTPESASDGKETMWVDFKVNLVPVDGEATAADTETDAITVSELSFTGVPDTFDIKEPVKLSFTCPVAADKVTVSYNGGAFPEGTKYSADNKTYNILGEKMTVSTAAVSAVWLDFSEADLDFDNLGKITLGVTVYSGGKAAAAGSKVTEPYYTKEVIPIFGGDALAAEISFHEVMLLELYAPSDAQTLKLSFNGGAFPKGTRYSTDGKTYIMSEREETINFDGGGKIVRLYMDFSRVSPSELPQWAEFTATAYSGIVPIREESVAASATLTPLTAVYDVSQMVIEQGGTLSVAISGHNDETKLLIERLEADGYKSAADSFGLGVSEGEGELIVSNSSCKAKAGTYRLTLLREQNGVELVRIEIPFFIHY